MSALDATIDGLYQLPLNEFTGARNALAKSLGRDEAARVRALAKPTVAAWAVNQVYWRARGAFDRLMRSGEALRAAHVAVLEGRTADVRGAGDAHQRSVADAVAEARHLAELEGANPNADALARTFESLSLATTASEAPGRLTAELQPAGFETLAGIAPQPERTPAFTPTRVEAGAAPLRGGGADPRVGPRAKDPVREAAQAKRAAEEAARAAAERNKHEAAVRDAAAQLARAEADEHEARNGWERAHDALLDARRRLAQVKAQP